MHFAIVFDMRNEQRNISALVMLKLLTRGKEINGQDDNYNMIIINMIPWAVWSLAMNELHH